MIIAIDGPAGAGKSTIAKLLAAKLGIVYLDTGAMYRAAGLKALETGVSFSDENAVKEMLDNTTFDVVQRQGGQRVYLDGRDVTDSIREHKVSKAASDISAVPCVRYKMVELQREIASRRDTVLDGRDIGTFVLPGADFKFYLTASIEERAQRRYKELKAKGESCTLEKVAEDIAARDYNDSHRALAPLKKADDAVEIDTTSLSVEAVAEKITAIIGAGK
jgi:cytidylate kinase